MSAARVARVAVPVQLAAAGVVVAATFLPWAHSGRRPIDVYEGGALADRIDLISAPWMLRLAVALPLVLAVSAVLRWVGRGGAAAAVALVAGWYVVAIAAVATWRLDPSVRGGGALVALTGATFLVGAVVVELVFGRQAVRAGGRDPRRG